VRCLTTPLLWPGRPFVAAIVSVGRLHAMKDSPTTQVLVQERVADLDEDQIGNVRATVDHLLGAAHDALWERQRQEPDGALVPDGVATASLHVAAAIEVLFAYRDRLTELHERDSEEVLPW
jgi:hypothetical protein